MTLKENEIIKLNDIVRSLREEKALVQEKLSYAEKQIVMCMNRIRELDFKVDELSDEIEVGFQKYVLSSKNTISVIFIPFCRKRTARLNI